MSNSTRPKRRGAARIWRAAACCALVGLIVGVRWISGAAPAAPAAAAESIPAGTPRPRLAAKELKYIGVGGCAAVACHGGPLPTDSKMLWNCSYTIWASQQGLGWPKPRANPPVDQTRRSPPVIDKHNRAYAVLFEPRAKRIVQLLDRLPTQEAAQPQLDIRCLGCHTVPVAPPTLVSIGTRADGVGCELCHGPAKNWLTGHTENSWLASYHAGKFEPLPDMNNTRSLLSRARICANCHVGAPAAADQLPRDVDHDLIAAGHPRLNFNFHAYLGVLPKHWTDVPGAKAGFKTDRETHAEAWAIGQTVAAEAALRLLADRARHTKVADHADSRICPWPEFSEYDCYACHHALTETLNPRQTASLDAHQQSPKPGSLPYGTWYFPEVKLLIAGKPLDERRKNLNAHLDELSEKMATISRAPDRREIADLAERAAGEIHDLADLLATKTFDEKTVNGLLIRAADPQFQPRNWDEAAQRFLTVEALWRARQFFRLQRGAVPGQDEEKVTATLADVRRQLEFDADSNGPRARLNPNEVGDLIRNVVTAMGLK